MLNRAGHRTFRGVPYIEGNLVRIRRATRLGCAPQRFAAFVQRGQALGG
jgi:hypothetical protein